MENPLLKDQNEFPDDEVLGRYLGQTKKTWDSFMDFINENHPSFSGEWRYYSDGNNWLYKLMKKKKTICWISIYQNMFKTTFYFPDRAEDLISKSNLNSEYIRNFITGKRYGKIRGVTIDIKHVSDLENTKLLIEIKEQLK